MDRPVDAHGCPRAGTSVIAMAPRRMAATARTTTINQHHHQPSTKLQHGPGPRPPHPSRPRAQGSQDLRHCRGRHRRRAHHPLGGRHHVCHRRPPHHVRQALPRLSLGQDLPREARQRHRGARRAARRPWKRRPAGRHSGVGAPGSRSLFRPRVVWSGGSPCDCPWARRRGGRCAGGVRGFWRHASSLPTRMRARRLPAVPLDELACVAEHSTGNQRVDGGQPVGGDVSV
jgi:hypothetical protein